jgi:hypothetical protein
MSLDLAEEKWYKKASSRAKKWEANVKSSTAFDAYVKKIAGLIRKPEDEVRASESAKAWAEFQTKASDYRPKFESGIRIAHETKKWSKNYASAFSRTPE